MKIAVHIPDMVCPSCVVPLLALEDELPGILHIEASYRRRLLSVHFDEAALTAGAIVRAVEGLGFHPQYGGVILGDEGESVPPQTEASPSPCAPREEVLLPVSGMSCSACAGIIERQVRRIPGVHEAVIDLAGGTLRVACTTGNAAVSAVVLRLKRLGYGVPCGTVTFRVGGLAGEPDALRLERSLERERGVVGACVRHDEESVTVEFVVGLTGVARLAAASDRAGFPVRQPETLFETPEESSLAAADPAGELRHLVLALILTVPLVAYSMTRDLAPVKWHYDLPVMLAAATVVQFVVGFRFYAGAWRALRAGGANMDVLIVLGSSVAYLYSLAVVAGVIPGSTVYFETGAAIITLIRLGKFLETRARARTSGALSALERLRPKLARVERDGSEMEIPSSEVLLGDVVQIRAGEAVPVDGVVVAGKSSCDEAMITGEAMPVAKGAGDAVIGGTLNLDGALRVEATAVGSEATLERIVSLVRGALATKAPVQKLTDEIGRYFVPLVVLAALCTLFGWRYVAGIEWAGAMINAVAVLVIACPCAIGLATPTAVMVGMTKGAERGILFRNSAILERTGKVTSVVFDKTGTITTGRFEVTDIVAAERGGTEELLRLAASAELGSEHPLAEAVVQAARARELSLTRPAECRAIAGFGVDAQVGGETVLIGNKRLMAREGVLLGRLAPDIDRLEREGKTVMIVACADRGSQRAPEARGALALADTVKPGAGEAIAALRALGVEVAMITGDNRQSAEAVAARVGIGRVLAEVAPGGKADEIARLQQAGAEAGTLRPVIAMVGDGINDAPALAQADVGIAIGTGTEVAAAAAGIALVGGDLAGVYRAVALSRATTQTILQNLVWALFYNVALIPVAGYGLLTPMIAAGAMTLSSLLVVTNSLRLRCTALKKEPAQGTAAEGVSLLPRILVPIGTLALLIIVPMWTMAGGPDIRGALTGSMTPLLMMVMAISNGLIAVSYSSIPVFLTVFIWKRKDIPFSWIALLFGGFILACGSTHFIHVIGLWRPVGWWQGAADSACAAISLATAIVLWPLLPKMLAIPSPTQMHAVNRELSEEKAKLELAQEELLRSYSDVEQRVKERTAELEITNRALEEEISERKLAQTEREHLIDQLQDKTGELERFIYTVSHDLKSPLITISGFIGFLKEDFAARDEGSFDATIGRIAGAAEKMRQLLDELLELSRIGRKASPPQPVPLEELVAEAIELLSGRITTCDALVEVQPGLPTVVAERQRLLQVYENLIDNAVKFSADANPPRIVIGMREESGDRVFFVQDNGIGIEPRYLFRIFELFEKLDPHSSGTGVGLAIVHRIIAIHGGRLWAESDGPGTGTTFCFTIPPPKGEPAP